jgi:integrase
MSAAFKPKRRTIHVVKIRSRAGKWIAKTTGTRDPITAKKMQAMIDVLGPTGERAQDILDAVISGRTSVPALYDMWRLSNRDVGAIRAQLADIDLEPLVAQWEKAISGAEKPSADTIAHYLHHVRTLIPKGAPFLRSHLTSERLQQWLDELDVSAATKRKAAAGMASFTSWLGRRRLAPMNLMRDVQLPAAGKPRIHYLETDEAKRLADAQPEPYRSFSAMLAGTGIEVSVALTLRRRDVDVAHREIRAPGTKTHTRDRTVRVAEWAWPYVLQRLSGLLPDARLFADIPDRWEARDAHSRAITGTTATDSSPAVQGLEQECPIFRGYTMRDQRHTYAVRAIRAGTPAELIARQLGHANAVLVHKVYGRFSPDSEEREKWELIATARDLERKVGA